MNNTLNAATSSFVSLNVSLIVVGEYHKLKVKKWKIQSTGNKLFQVDFSLDLRNVWCYKEL